MINSEEENNRINDSVSKETTQTEQESTLEVIIDVFSMPKPIQDFISAIYKENRQTTYGLKLTEQEYKPKFHILTLFFKFRRIGYIPIAAFNNKEQFHLTGIEIDKPHGEKSRINITYWYNDKQTTN